MQEKNNKNRQLVDFRAYIPIYYSSMTGCSKTLAYKFQEELQRQKFFSTVINIGDYSKEQFTAFQGTVVMFLSTYGSGGPPQDGQDFFEWINALKLSNVRLNHLNFIIFALGNTSFDHFCGHGKKIRQALIDLQAKQIMEMFLSDASSETDNYREKYEQWVPEALSILKGLHQIKKVPKSNVLNQYNLIIHNKNLQNWEQLGKKQQNLSAQFKNFLHYHKMPVVHIKQLRKIDDGRSTLWVRLKNTNIPLKVTQNFQFYPENITKIKEQCCDKVLEFIPPSQKYKKPFCNIPANELQKIINLNSIVNKPLIKKGLVHCEASESVQQKYRALLELKDQQITCRIFQMLEQLKLNYEFYPYLGLNALRSYTLASSSQQYLDFIISLSQKGLCSRFLSSKPEFIRIRSSEVGFQIPADKKPIIMVANGSGMAPFRGIAHYIASLPEQKRNPLYFYYGCQNVNKDFYFKQQWQSFQNQSIVKIRIAESRHQTQKKYVQKLIEEDKQKIKQIIFDEEGYMFICGGQSMSKSVKLAIFQVCKLKQKIPYKAMKLQNELNSHKRVVEEVFE